MRTIFRNHTIYGPTDLSCKFKTERKRNSNCSQGNKQPTSLVSGININNVKNALVARFWWHITWQLPFGAWLETGEGKGKTYSCWSLFIWENALLCRDMMALSLRSLENSQIQHRRVNYGRTCPWGMATPHRPPHSKGKHSGWTSAAGHTPPPTHSTGKHSAFVGMCQWDHCSGVSQETLTKAPRDGFSHWGERVIPDANPRVLTPQGRWLICLPFSSHYSNLLLMKCTT